MLNKYFSILISISSLMLSACGGSSSEEGDAIATDTATCSTQSTQNEALWSYMQDDYFWNEQLDLSTDPSKFSSLSDLMADIRNKVELDRFSNVMSEKDYQDNFISAIFYGYGLSTQLNEAKDGLKVRYVFETSNAAAMGLTRGALITSINGKTIENAVADGSYDSKAVWGPNENGYTSTVTWIDTNQIEQTGEMSRADTETNTVLATNTYSTNIGKVGYLAFNSFIERSADDLNKAFSFFKKEGIAELIVDLRYNSGGFIKIANQLASQIAGDNVIGKGMQRYIYNNSNSGSNKNLIFDLGEGKDPLNLSKVIILTTERTASASEMTANALAPYIDVKIVGSRSSGKPVGMDINQLCEHRVFAVNFQTVNADGFGDYFDGLAVDCSAEDTIAYNWGDERDPLLKEALFLLNNNSCSSETTGSEQRVKSNNDIPNGIPLKKNDYLM